MFVLFLIPDCLSNHQDFLGDDFKSQGSHVPYNVADFSTQVHIKEILVIVFLKIYSMHRWCVCVDVVNVGKLQLGFLLCYQLTSSYQIFWIFPRCIKLASIIGLDVVAKRQWMYNVLLSISRCLGDFNLYNINNCFVFSFRFNGKLYLKENTTLNFICWVSL